MGLIMDIITQNLRPAGCEFVVDLNYGRRHNFWQTLANRLNARFMDGISSLAFQTRRTFALWTGIQIPPEELQTTLNLFNNT